MAGLIEPCLTYNAHVVARCDLCAESFRAIMVHAPLEVQSFVVGKVMRREINGSPSALREMATRHVFRTTYALAALRLRKEDFGEAATAFARLATMEVHNPSADRAIFTAYKMVCRNDAVAEGCGLADAYPNLDDDPSLPGPCWRDVGVIHGPRYAICRHLPGRIISAVAAARGPVLAGKMLAWAGANCRWHILRSLPKYVSPGSETCAVALEVLKKSARPGGRAYLECIHEGASFLQEPSTINIDDDVDF